ncbi:CBASS oligonucleotide cyclase [Bradyrhizobium sp. 2S1]|uniref:CBASS oligonucleotide cyclase n=1 Tax=Bradyrhizobium sp. 2S1 TaxID=1404429 RepID=UPI00140A123D|nr:CBASS oligonucleotide cyclase [Bradyrhizobium sp. 2S1]MCK7664527.1 nucleotidyltransferase [Bradyrhizobium sp. 2S1]
MITVEEAFETFRQRLELSETERKDTIRKHTSVRDCIRGGFDISRDFLTGSYDRHTKTKPLKDVDVFFVLGPKDQHWRQKPPSEILDAFVARLRGEFGKDAVEPGRRCATTEFERNTQDKEGKVLSIDSVPAIELSDCYEIPDRDLGRWIKTDPEIHAEKSTTKNKTLSGKWVPLVKMLKRWNRSADKPIKPSFLIEVMAQDLVDGPFTNYPGEVRRFFAAALDGISREWKDPAGLGPPVSDQMTPDLVQKAVTALRRAETEASRAVRLSQQGKQGEALAIWREIMGRYFPTS